MRAFRAHTDQIASEGTRRRPVCPLLPKLAAAFASSSALLIASSSSAQEPPRHLAEFGASVGWIQRTAVKDASHNPSQIGYGAALGETVQFKAQLWPWLRLGAYYQRAYHKVEIPTSSLRPPGTEIDLGSMLAFSIGARLEPTLVLTPRLRLWGILGIGWGRMTVGRMKVSVATGSYTVQEREGVLVEAPMGLGGAFHVIPGWLAVTFDTTISPNYAQSGSLHEPTQYVDSSGMMRHTEPMPELSYTFAQMFGVALLL